MVLNTQNYWDTGLGPSFGIKIRKRRFGNWIVSETLFPSF
jgi:hypothetical protein